MINIRQAKKYCKEDISKIENYEQAMNDQTQMWCCHHRTEIWWNCSQKDLIENECYYNRKALELIFLTKEEHNKLHKSGTRHPMYGKTRTFSDDHKRKISEANKGRLAPNKGKPMSAEQKQKLSDAKKAYWAKRKEGDK